MNETQSEDLFLQKCPRCGAWPMSFVDLHRRAWQPVKLKFSCAVCHEETIGPIDRNIPERI